MSHEKNYDECLGFEQNVQQIVRLRKKVSQKLGTWTKVQQIVGHRKKSMMNTCYLNKTYNK